MSGIHPADANAVLDAMCGGATPYTHADPLYLALVTAAVVDADTGSTITEPTYTGYTRVAVHSADWNAAVNMLKSNLNTISFAACTAGASDIVQAVLVTAAAAGDVVAVADLSPSPMHVAVGVTPQFLGGAPGQLVLALLES